MPNLTKPSHKSPPRPLTVGERHIAWSVFGEHLALDDIRLTVAWWVLKGYAVSPNGFIYFHKDDFAMILAVSPCTFGRGWCMN